MQEKKMIAFYREKRNGQLKVMYENYSRKKDFEWDIRGNGLRLLTVLNKKDVKKIMQYKYRFNDITEYIKQVRKVREYFNLDKSNITEKIDNDYKKDYKM